MNTYYDNPARKLFDIVTKFNLYSDGETNRQVWKEVLSMPDASDVELMLAIGKVFQLMDDIVLHFSETDPEYIGICHDWMQDIGAALRESLSFGYSCKDAKNHLTDTRLLFSAVKLIDGDISKVQKQRNNIINSQTLKEIHDEIQGLYDSVLQAEISDELKCAVLKYLNRLKEAINHYAITGSEAVITAIEAAIGHMAFNSEYQQYMMQKDGLGRRIMTFMGKVASAFTVVDKGLDLIGKTSDVLEKIS